MVAKAQYVVMKSSDKAEHAEKHAPECAGNGLDPNA
jgi:hypothetical protein